MTLQSLNRGGPLPTFLITSRIPHPSGHPESLFNTHVMSLAQACTRLESVSQRVRLLPPGTLQSRRTGACVIVANLDIGNHLPRVRACAACALHLRSIRDPSLVCTVHMRRIQY